MSSLYMLGNLLHCVVYHLCSHFCCLLQLYAVLLFKMYQYLRLSPACVSISLGTMHSALSLCSGRHYIWRSWTCCGAGHELAMSCLAPFPITCGIASFPGPIYTWGESGNEATSTISRWHLVPFPDPQQDCIEILGMRLGSTWKDGSK